MKTILEAEAVYREAEEKLSRELEADAARISRKSKLFLWLSVIAVPGIVLIAFDVDWGVWLALAGMACLITAMGIWQSNRWNREFGDTSEVDAAIDELELAQERWVESHGLELPSGALEDLGFDTLPDRSQPEVYGSTQLLDPVAGKVVPVVLKMDPAKGYVLYGAEGQLLRALDSDGEKVVA